MKSALIRALYAVTSRIGPCRRWPNRLRRAVLPRLDGWARRRYDRPLVRDKTAATDEYVTTVARPICEVERYLRDGGYRRNVLATCKYRGGDGGRRYERASWARHDGQRQHHVYLFDHEGGVDVYAHEETSYLASATGHEDGQQVPGDPNGRLRGLVEWGDDSE